LSAGFEQSLQCGSVEPLEVCIAGDLVFRALGTMTEGVCVTVTFRRFFYLISDPQERGVYVTFV